MRRPTPRARALLLVPPCLLAACGGEPPDKQRETIASWTATSNLVLAERRHDRMPVLYATELRDKARVALGTSRTTMAATPMSAADRRATQASLDSLREALAGLDHELLAP